METSGRDDDLSGAALEAQERSDLCPLCQHPIDWPELRLVEGVVLGASRWIALSPSQAQIMKAVMTRPRNNEALIDQIWGDDPNGGPLTAQNMLSVFISQMNKRLRVVGWTIRRIGHGQTGVYALQPLPLPTADGTAGGALELHGRLLSDGQRSVRLSKSLARLAGIMLSGIRERDALAARLYGLPLDDRAISRTLNQIGRLRQELAGFGFTITSSEKMRRDDSGRGKGAIYSIIKLEGAR